MTWRTFMSFSSQNSEILRLASQMSSVSPSTEKFITRPSSSRERSSSRKRVSSGCRRWYMPAAAHQSRTVTASLSTRNHQGLQPRASARYRLAAAARKTRLKMMALAQRTCPETL